MKYEICQLGYRFALFAAAAGRFNLWHLRAEVHEGPAGRTTPSQTAQQESASSSLSRPPLWSSSSSTCHSYSVSSGNSTNIAIFNGMQLHELLENFVFNKLRELTNDISKPAAFYHSCHYLLSLW